MSLARIAWQRPSIVSMLMILDSFQHKTCQRYLVLIFLKVSRLEPGLFACAYNRRYEDEIEAILKEVSVEGKVSYSDFLALWEHRQEQQRAKVMKEIDIPRSSSWDVNLSSDVSVLSDEFENEGDAKAIVQARASFLEGKKMSERKVPQPNTAEFVMSPEKHVDFSEHATIIPEPCMESSATDNGVILTSDV